MFQKIEKMVGASDFRASMSSYLKNVKDKPLVIGANRGQNPFVVMSINTYNNLVEAREDEIDARELARLVKENRGKKKVSWAKVK